MSVTPGAAIPGLAVPGEMTPAWPAEFSTPPQVPLQFWFGAPMSAWFTEVAGVAWHFGAPAQDNSFSPPSQVP